MPGPQNYEWRRYWYPIDAPVPIVNGFLSPSEDDQGGVLSSFVQVPCLVLLGAPGMGKSYEARHLEAVLRAHDENVDFVEAPRRRDLSTTLVNLASSPHATAWEQFGAKWHVIIDGLDEIDGGASASHEALRRFLNVLSKSSGNPSNLRLRLFCRAAEWASSIEHTLGELWSSSNVEVRQLAPLTASDIKGAADAELGDSTDAATFTQSIANTHTEALAARPVSLRMLLNLFRNTHELPAKQVQLFYHSLSTLVKDDRPTARSSDLTPEALILLAGRIATAMTVAGTPILSTGIGVGDGDASPALVLALSTLVDGTEPIAPASFRVRHSDLIDVVRSPLFHAIGNQRFVWAHQTFREFLAANYLVAHELQPDALIDLLSVRDPVNASAGVAPQLREVAAWSAALSPDVFKLLLDREPDVLLHSDIATVEPRTKERLVAALLEQLSKGATSDTFWRLRPLLSGLRHENLSAQLRETLRDKAQIPEVRRGAIDIAEECRLVDLTTTLGAIALDDDEPLVIRREAAKALVVLGSLEGKEFLVTLLQSEISEHDDELLGQTLLATWPNDIPFSLLISALREPTEPDHIGSYALFLHEFKLGPLSAPEALLALSFVDTHMQNGASRATGFSFRRVIPQLFWASTAQAGDPTVLRALAGVIHSTFDAVAQDGLDLEDDGPTWRGSPDERVSLILTTLETARDPVQSGRYLSYFFGKLVASEDMRPLLSAYPSVKPQAFRVALAELIVSLSRQYDLNDLGDVWEQATEDPFLNAAWLASYLIPLDSPSIDWMRRASARDGEAASRREQQETARRRADTSIRDLIAAFQTGDLDAWWQLNLELCVTESGRYDGSFEFQSDLTHTPGWARLSSEQRADLQICAREYLARYRLNSLSWLGTNTLHRPAAAGYRAARLLLSLNPQWVSALDSSVWRAWAPAFLGFFDNDHNAAVTIQAPLVAEAYKMAPRSVLRAIARIARGQDSEGPTNRTLELLEVAYDNRLGRALSRLRGDRLRGDDSDQLIVSFLIRHGFAPLIEDVRLELSARTSNAIFVSRLGGAAFAEAAASMLAAPDPGVWKLVNKLSDADASTARMIWEHLASHQFRSSALELASIEEGDLENSYLVLRTFFPQRLERTSGARFLSAVDFAERLSSRVLSELVGRASGAAIRSLYALKARMPNDLALKYSLPQAQRAFRAKSANRDPVELLRRVAILGVGYPERPAPRAPSPPSALTTAVPPKEPVTTIDFTTLTDRREAVPIGSRVFSVVSLATEWKSAHGGVSTLNRDLCIALAERGDSVTCIVLDPSPDEVRHANDRGVDLIPCVTATGILDRERFLLLRAEDLPSGVPDFVFGHDQITGQYALQFARTIASSYIHFLHTSPEDIEPHKDRSHLFRGEERRRAQRAICENAQLIVAVGPRIAERAPVVDEVPIHQLTPGLNQTLTERQQRSPRTGICLMSGRMEDARLKGLPTAGAVIWRLNEQHSLGDRPSLIVRGLDPVAGEEQILALGLTEMQWHACIKPRPFTAEETELFGDLSEAAVVLMPSLAEGFGLTGLEAIAAGTPVLLTEESGLSDWLIELEKRGTIDEGFMDACIAQVIGNEGACLNAWTEKLDRLLNDRAAALGRAEALRHRLKLEFTWAKAAEALTSALATLPTR